MIDSSSAGRFLRAAGLLAFVLAVLSGAAPKAVAGGQLLEVRCGVQPEYTRIVLDMSGTASYVHRLELTPPRVVVQIPGGSAAKGLSPRALESPLVAGVRVDRLRGPTTLVVIDLSRPCAYRTFTLPAERNAHARIVVDLFAGESAPPPPGADSLSKVGDGTGGSATSGGEGSPPAAGPAGAGPADSAPSLTGSETGEAIPAPAETIDAASEPASNADVQAGKDEIEEFTPAEPLRVAGAGVTRQAPAPAAPQAQTGTPAKNQAQTPSSTEAQPEAVPPPAQNQAPVRGGEHAARKRIVAIDAGHGGPDTGAQRGSIDEKRICLDFAKRLAASINAVDGYEAYLTRDDDTFLPLRRRYQLAEARGADVFVSIHANAARSRAATGTEVFFLSLDGASDEAALELARKENESDQIGGVSPEAEEDLTSIIRDLRRSDALRRSSFLAEAVLDELQEIPGVESRGVKQAGFTVLKSPRMPSILVETGFLSNAHERSLLTDPKYQDVFVRRMRDGLLGFFQKYGLAQP